ncbi:hypothetical protein [Flavobacterium sp. JP2137]|uniref:hypothetical protein n=1 Tax=Flavobacterium sp. JP2137 TaxID=3414510 RepID=UPI003D30011C
MKTENDFKRALAQLPSKEKDKLIWRLLKRDSLLTKKLHFELVGQDNVEQRRTAMEEKVIERVAEASFSYYSPSYLLLDLRSISAGITEHVKITSDKYGEISLNLLMLTLALILNEESLQKATPKRLQSLYTYIVARSFKTLVLIQALGMDWFVAFEEKLSELSTYFHHIKKLETVAINNGLQIEWLLNIPDNIDKIHREIRDAGLLK